MCKLVTLIYENVIKTLVKIHVTLFKFDTVLQVLNLEGYKITKYKKVTKEPKSGQSKPGEGFKGKLIEFTLQHALKQEKVIYSHWVCVGRYINHLN